ncbi:MAG: 2-hydroxychromene-2-carboxylate isomerase [Pseudomonadota bacterium]
MNAIDYYFTPLSPFTYLAGLELEAIAARHGATISYKPFNLMDIGKETGFVPVPQRHKSRQTYRMQELRRIAAFRKLPITLKPAHWPSNPVPAATAIIAAQEAGGGDLGLLVHAIMRSCWAEEKDFAEDAVIAACLAEAGFDPALAGANMLKGAETYQRFSDEALAAGVFGSPFYVVGDEKFWGQDRLAYLDRYLGA